MVALYNSMAKLETIENNGIPLKISHGKNHAVSKMCIRDRIECEAADKRAYDLIKVLKYIIKGAGFELTERVQVKDTKTGRVYR